MAKKAAKIDVSITTFNDVTASPPTFSVASVVLNTADSPNGVTQPGGANTRIDVADSMRMIFRFEADYKPIDVMFVQTTGISDDDGRMNLTSRIRQKKNNGKWVLVLNNTLTDGGAINSNAWSKWKYFIAIQKISTGKFGIIDPEISNVDQD